MKSIDSVKLGLVSVVAVVGIIIMTLLSAYNNNGYYGFAARSKGNIELAPGLSLEAESGTSQGFLIGQDPKASDNQYIYSTDREGSITYSIAVDKEGLYKLSTKVATTTPAANSFDVQLNDENEISVNVENSNNYKWTDVSGNGATEWYLQPGSYTIRIRHATPGVRIDSIRLSWIGSRCADNDGDGYGRPSSELCLHQQEDCNDRDAAINPGAEEICGNNKDENCNKQKNDGCPGYCVDNDGDGYGENCENGLDCDDDDPDVHALLSCNYDGNSCSPDSALCIASCPVPPAEICGNSVDEDCDGVVELCEESSALTRSFSANPADPDADIIVTITKNLQSGQTTLLTEEYVPDELTIINAGTGVVTGHTIRWAELTGAQSGTYTYTVSVPSEQGIYFFGGSYTINGGSSEPIGGEQDLGVLIEPDDMVLLLSLGETKTISRNGQEYTLILTGYDMHNLANNWHDTVHMTINGNAFSIRQNEYVEVSGVPLYAQDIFISNIGQNDATIQLRIPHDLCNIYNNDCNGNVCGDRILVPSEQCDTTNGFGSCSAIGFNAGYFYCSQCVVQANCYNETYAPVCGNDYKDLNLEQCDGDDLGYVNDVVGMFDLQVPQTWSIAGAEYEITYMGRTQTTVVIKVNDQTKTVQPYDNTAIAGLTVSFEALEQDPIMLRLRKVLNTCESLGYGSGDLSCSQQCTYDTSDCTGVTGFPVNTLVQAESGNNNGFLISDGYVYSDDDELNSISYDFAVPTTGQYVIETGIVDPNSGTNSFYIGVDGFNAQGNNAYIYDSTEGTGIVDDTVRLRGPGGSPTSWDYDPMVYNLTAGIHTFTFYGRERLTKMDYLTLSSYAVPSACQNGQTQSCQTGLQGVCAAGTQTCSNNAWGSCVQNNQPATDICGNGIDEDCNGVDLQCTGGAISRSFSSDPAGTNTVVTVTLTKTLQAGQTTLLTEEYLPEGVTIINSGTGTISGNVIRWAELTGAQSGTYTYTVRTSNISGNVTFYGMYSVNGGSTVTIVGDTQLSIQGTPASCQNGQTQSCNTGHQGICSVGTQTCSNNVWGSCTQNNQPATEICGNGIDEDCDGSDIACANTTAGLFRSFSNSPVTGGSTLTVTITKNLQAGQTTLLTEEYVPAGFIIVNAGTGTATGNTIRWAELTGAQTGTYTYTVTAPGTGGTYDFSGSYTINGGNAQTIGGSNTLTVGDTFVCSSGDTQDCATDEPGACAIGLQTCSNNVWGSCVAPTPTIEVCNNDIDEDCDGTLNNGCEGFCDTDGDGHEQSLLLWCFIYGPVDDCNDNNANINPDATEICGNGVDEDCSGADLACPNTPPIVSISSPVTGSTFNQGENITVVALASDPNGSISKVEFYRNNALVRTDASFPYSYQWNNVAAGNYNIYARAYDNLNASTNSTPIVVNVITPPVINTTLFPPETVVEAENGIIVPLMQSGIGSGETYIFSPVGSSSGGWSGSATYNFYLPVSGRYWIEARVLAANGSADSFFVGVDGQNALGNGEMVYDAVQGTVFTWDNVSLRGPNFDGENALYDPAYWNLTSGNHNITFYGREANLLLDKIILRRVIIPNSQPSVAIIYPVSGSQFVPGSSITINATASDSDGIISRVEFFRNGTLIGNDTSAPFQSSWNNMQLGSYVLTARAVDNAYGSATSNSVNVYVQNPAVCGNAVCELGESCSSCSGDCGVCPVYEGWDYTPGLAGVTSLCSNGVKDDFEDGVDKGGACGYNYPADLPNPLPAGVDVFYISNSGNDNNDGRSPATAWATLNKLHNSWNLIGPGDYVLFQRGGTWRPNSYPSGSGGLIDPPFNKSGAPNAYITLGAYGTGAKPIISAGAAPTISGYGNSRFIMNLDSTNGLNYFVFQDIEFRGVFWFRGEGTTGSASQSPPYTHLKFLRNKFEGNAPGDSVTMSMWFEATREIPTTYNPETYFTLAQINNIEFGYNIFNNSIGADTLGLSGQGYNWIHHNEIYNSRISTEANEGESIDISEGNYNRIEYNIISGSGGYNLKIQKHGNTEDYCVVRGNLFMGASLYSDGASPMTMIGVRWCNIEDNTFVMNLGGDWSWNAGYDGHVNPVLYPDTMSEYGIYGNVMKNNIFYGRHPHMFAAKTMRFTFRDGSTQTFSYNDIWTNNRFENNTYWNYQFSDGSIHVREYVSPSGFRWVTNRPENGNYDLNSGAYTTSGGGSDYYIDSSTFNSQWLSKPNVVGDKMENPQLVSPSWTNSWNYGNYRVRNTSSSYGRGAWAAVDKVVSTVTPVCTSGQTQPCTTGLQGVCAAGTQTCSNNAWGSCVQNNQPATDICGNGVDEDCNGADLTCPIALTRGFSNNPASGNSTVTVTLTKTLQAGQSTLLTEEYVPSGFTIINAGTGSATGNTIRWAELTGAQSGTYTYTVRTSINPGLYNFSGLYTINGGASANIGGSSQLTVQEVFVCNTGQTQSCTTGLQGVCAAGTQTCSNNAWGSCVQNNQPATDICGNGVDEDCNGADLACNAAPIVNVGIDRSVTLPNTLTLSATVTDDGLPNPPATTTVRWTRQSGPGTVTFGDSNAINTTASFSTNGTYVLRLRANDSVLTGQDTLTVTVYPQPVNILPVVSIFAPSNGTNYVYPSYVIINASASDSDGSISRVEFYADGSLRGTDTTYPYSYVWTNASIGTHILTAKAYDNQNGTTTSSPVTIGMVQPICTNGQTQSCTTGLLGICSAGTATCSNNNWGTCVQNTQPSTEICGNGIDEDCNGVDLACPVSGLSRIFPENIITAGSTFTVTIAKNLQPGQSTLLTEEYVPAGFTISNAGTGTAAGNIIRWAELIGATSGTYTYSVRAPATSGSYIFSGVYSINGGSEAPIVGDMQLTVQ